MPVSLFVNDQDEVTVVLYVAASPKGFVYCDTDKDTLVKIASGEIDPKDIEQHQAVFRTPSYGDSNKILDAGMRMSDLETLNISPNEIRSARISTLIKSWTFKTAKGEEVKPTKEAVKKLHPTIATALGVALELELKDRGLL